MSAGKQPHFQGPLVAWLKTVCHLLSRQVGFPLGAKEAIPGSHFGSGSGEILLDELDCKTGREGGIQECSFDPWKQHDCGDGEWAGVVCKVEEDSCKEDDEFRSGFR